MIQINNREINGKKFTVLILIQSAIWTILGLVVGYYLSLPVQPILLIMGASTVALFLLIRLVKILLDPELPGPVKILQFILFSFFKFLCLAFLAITLKRFQELPNLFLVAGVTFYWMSPAVAGLLCSKD